MTERRHPARSEVIQPASSSEPLAAETFMHEVHQARNAELAAAGAARPTAAGDKLDTYAAVAGVSSNGSYSARAMLNGLHLSDSSSGKIDSDSALHEVATKAHNIADIGETLAAGTADAVVQTARSVGATIGAGAQWVKDNPGKAAMLAGSVAAAAAVEIGTGGLATPVVAAGLEAVGGLGTLGTAAAVGVAGYQTGKAVNDVVNHGDLGTLFNQEKHTTQENDKARARLKQDTGAALLADVSLGVGLALRAAQGGTEAGASLKAMEDRWEDPTAFQKAVQGKLELDAYSQPAEPGAPRGDLLRVATTPDGNLLLTAMDVEGHGVRAAQKATAVHNAIDQLLPETAGKSASDILSEIDSRLDTTHELAVPAALAKYAPATGDLQVATAGSEYAYVVRANGEVQRLDGEVGGIALGNGLYSAFPRGNEVTHLSMDDTVFFGSDGAVDRFGGFGNPQAFEDFLKSTGPNPSAIHDGILKAHANEAPDDTSFIIFRRPGDTTAG